jgi:hypothetical protein
MYIKYSHTCLCNFSAIICAPNLVSITLGAVNHRSYELYVYTVLSYGYHQPVIDIQLAINNILLYYEGHLHMGLS